MAKDEATFASTNLAQGEYDDETHEMIIEFQNGRTYRWERVEPVMWDRLKSAPSAGQFLLAKFSLGTEI